MFGSKSPPPCKEITKDIADGCGSLRAQGSWKIWTWSHFQRKKSWRLSRTFSSMGLWVCHWHVVIFFYFHGTIIVIIHLPEFCFHDVFESVCWWVLHDVQNVSTLEWEVEACLQSVGLMCVFLWPSESCSFCHDCQRSLERGERCKDPATPRIGHLCVGVKLLLECIIQKGIWDLHLLKTATSSSYKGCVFCLVCSSFRNNLQKLWKQVIKSPNHQPFCIYSPVKMNHWGRVALPVTTRIWNWRCCHSNKTAQNETLLFSLVVFLTSD